jgi:hypothetical protein
MALGKWCPTVIADTAARETAKLIRRFERGIPKQPAANGPVRGAVKRKRA